MSESAVSPTPVAPPSRSLTPNRVFLIFDVLVTLGVLSSLVSIFSGGLLGVLEHQIAQNSEAFVLCLLVSLDLQFFRSSGWPRRLAWWALLALGYLVTELAASLPSAVVTLSEAFLAALLISLFLTLFQPGEPRWRFRWVVPVASLLIVLIGEVPLTVFEGVGPWIMSKAETWGFLLLISILIGYLASYPWTVVRPKTSTRVIWVLIVIFVPLGVAAINPHGVDSVAAVGPIESLMVWIQRITESFVAAVLLTALCWMLEPSRRFVEGDSARTP